MLFCFTSCLSPKEKAETESITLTNETILPYTSVRNQGRTSACWAYTMTSVMESDLLSQREDTVRLSVMYIVRQKYLKQFDTYYYSHGKEEIRGGSLGHSFLNIYKEKGIVPYEVYKGHQPDAKRHDHRKLLKELRHLAKKAVDKRDLPTYRKKAEELLDKVLGIVPDTFAYQGTIYTPRSFADSLHWDAERYMEVTSFTHHPFYEWFVLEVPDNWEHAPFYNLPLDVLEQCVKNAITHGQTVAWDGDTSENGFNVRQGMAIYPYSPVTQTHRQEGFEHFHTTDDHMMHLIGTAHDTEGHLYYVLKNSWGKHGPYQGLVYMSEDYFRAKTVSVTLPKEFVPIDKEIEF